MIFQPTKQQGFSLVEVLVAITILLFVIVGPMQIIARTIKSTDFATQQVNAWFLAQEGLELAQKGRDDLVLGDFDDQINSRSASPDPMTEFLSKYSVCRVGPHGCALELGTSDAATITVRDCSTTTNCQLYLDRTTDRSRFQHDPNNATASLFSRVIRMEPVNDTSGKLREIKVTSTVTWRSGSLISSQQVEAVTYLFNVYETD